MKAIISDRLRQGHRVLILVCPDIIYFSSLEHFNKHKDTWVLERVLRHVTEDDIRLDPLILVNYRKITPEDLHLFWTNIDSTIHGGCSDTYLTYSIDLEYIISCRHDAMLILKEA
jgi:hypothetical protein